MTHADKALNIFKQGYNCAQSVFAAFSDITGIPYPLSLKLAQGLGGGVARMREVCGTVTGAALVIGCLYGTDEADQQKKQLIYERVREIAEKYKSHTGSIICREVLGEAKTNVYLPPEVRSDEYYQKRPCARLVYLTASILEDYIQNHAIE